MAHHAMKKLARSILKQVLQTAVHGLVGAFLVLVVVAIFYLNSQPDLKVWHTAKLDAEFTAASPVKSFADYLALENRLFAQLDEKVYDRIALADKRSINRYYRGSLSDPSRWSPNWNRSYELSISPSTGRPKAGVLLIHGLTDSPYSLRSIAEKLNTAGAHVVGLRVPGHGTAPSGLTTVTWPDMTAAVRLAMRHLSEQAGGAPLSIVGYSNGGALAVHYALSSLEDPALSPLAGLVLISPEIGVTRTAALAIWQERIGRLLGLQKLAWTDVLPEYDPFKYGSFAANAGNVVYQLTGVNRAKIERLSAAGKLDAFPPVLAFQSAVDATVLAPALVKDLFARLPEHGHELVIFDLNRNSEIEPLLKSEPNAFFASLRDDPNRRYRISLLTNAGNETNRVIVRSWEPGQSASTESDPGLAWPAEIYSLAHVSLPFPGNDPVYGGDNPGKSPGIQLGKIALRGEKGVLEVPAAEMLRLRWNPFYSYLEKRVVEQLELGSEGTVVR
jgi:alpha-beta hydrolase superfamily lysophospholipase